MKKINVNTEACIGCGACVAIDPEHFEFNDNGLSEVINNENLESAELQNAMESCPTAAITLHEVSENCECENCECEECHCEEKCECDDACECEECHCHEENSCCCNHSENQEI